jgi:hypothetical protein
VTPGPGHQGGIGGVGGIPQYCPPRAPCPLFLRRLVVVEKRQASRCLPPHVDEEVRMHTTYTTYTNNQCQPSALFGVCTWRLAKRRT